ncbi:hypothetical protein JOM56_014422 [Amanita muscaria]
MASVAQYITTPSQSTSCSPRHKALTFQDYLRIKCSVNELSAATRSLCTDFLHGKVIHKIKGSCLKLLQLRSPQRGKPGSYLSFTSRCVGWETELTGPSSIIERPSQNLPCERSSKLPKPRPHTNAVSQLSRREAIQDRNLEHQCHTQKPTAMSSDECGRLNH